MPSEKLSGIEKAADRAMLKFVGLNDADLSRPLIGIIVAQAPSFVENNENILFHLKTSIIAQGGVPVVLNCISSNFGLTANANNCYCLPSRELIADSVQTILSVHNLDGVVLFGDGDIELTGLLLGAIRCFVPVIVFCNGTSVCLDKKNCSNIQSVLKGIGQVKTGKISLDELKVLENGVLNNGVHLHFNTMACLCESMGLSLIGNSTAPSCSNERIQLAKQTGKAITKLVEDSTLPNMILSKQAFNNAIATLCAINGNLDCVLHIIALAAACGITLTFDSIASISQKTPTLLSLMQNNQTGVDFHLAGGMGALLNQLYSINAIDADFLTVSNLKLNEQIKKIQVLDWTVIFPTDSPYLNIGCVGLLKGNLAEDGALIRRTPYNCNKLFVGKAKVFESLASALSALLNGNIINSGDIIVVKFEGPKGGPGMRDLNALCSILNGMGLQDSVAVVTDGRISFADGFAVGFICPEANEQGNLSAVREGDKIAIDLVKCKLEVDINAKELKNRIKKFEFKDNSNKHWLTRYANSVNSANKGAVLKK
ncbi:MAG: dihydroxy-acid dehydratase [Clostridiales bacterium]|jgi:dihydroxy-acid dehydratase|nr:dihydroxy-acid dehydratase [Clostridiales bacterium]